MLESKEGVRCKASVIGLKLFSRPANPEIAFPETTMRHRKIRYDNSLFISQWRDKPPEKGK